MVSEQATKTLLVFNEKSMVRRAKLKYSNFQNVNSLSRAHDIVEFTSSIITL